MDGKKYFCEICKRRQEATPEALSAWDDLVHYDCLCRSCYRAFDVRVFGVGMCVE